MHCGLGARCLCVHWMLCVGIAVWIGICIGGICRWLSWSRAGRCRGGGWGKCLGGRVEAECFGGWIEFGFAGQFVCAFVLLLIIICCFCFITSSSRFCFF